jgi:hypothetical protein
LGLSLPSADAITLVLAAVLVVLAGLIGYRWWRNSRVTPAERERRRRAQLAAHGKMGDASLVDLRDGHLFYTYDVRGVEYTASQDVTALGQVMPSDFSLAVGPILVKYDPRNPANSIVLAEGWSGFRGRA